MIIGVPKEIKNNENRVAITPGGVLSLVTAGHQVLIEHKAGLGSAFQDEDYAKVGATIVPDPKDAWAKADMVMKVKEPVPSEYGYFRNGLVLFTYLHLAAESELTKALVDSGVVGVAYETVQSGRTLPLLTPMSEIAGRMSVQIGARFLEKSEGGKGILLGGVPGVRRGKVTIIGGGIVGTNAAKMAIGLGANVTVVDVNPERLRELDDLFGRQLNTLVSNPFNIAELLKESDLVIGAVLIPGAKAPRLVNTEMVASMQPGSVIVDVAIDQGGIFETTNQVTTHDNPTYTKYGVVHYAVANMPGAVPQTSTIALTNSTVPYALQIANKGVAKAVRENEALLKGVNVVAGTVTNEAVARDLGYNYIPVNTAVEKILTTSVASV